ncbi:MAG: heme-binding protein [Ktedonobacteraceae bacterium]|nr:heme-binding protein [Ktedonobacteraceae bacterium]
MPNTLPTKPVLTLAAAKTIAAAAENEALKQDCSVAIAIVDDSGRLLYFQRMDENANASVDMAIAKAVHAVHFRRPTKFHEELLDQGNMAVLGVPGMVPVEGGLLLRVEEQVVGAIGVSGARSSQDGVFAQAGEHALHAYLSA